MAYTVPTAASFKARYPAFAAVDDATVDYWIEDAQRIVTTAWIEADYSPAILAYAARELSKPGRVASTGIASLAEKGVTSLKSASFSATFDPAAVAKLASGYADDFATYLRRNRGGPFTVSAPVGSCCP